MKSLSAPCDKRGFLSLSFPPVGEITERESRVRKAFFRSLLEPLVAIETVPQAVEQALAARAADSTL
jgi:hypothetical protein